MLLSRGKLEKRRLFNLKIYRLLNDTEKFESENFHAKMSERRITIGESEVMWLPRVFYEAGQPGSRNFYSY